MADHEPPNPDSDPFRPPDIPTLVGCLHCGQEYESYRIEWRIEPCADGKPRGFWCCPSPECGGKGFGFDILPLDPEYRDEHGGWITDDDDEEADGDLAELEEEPPNEPDPDTDLGDGTGEEELPW